MKIDIGRDSRKISLNTLKQILLDQGDSTYYSLITGSGSNGANVYHRDIPTLVVAGSLILMAFAMGHYYGKNK